MVIETEVSQRQVKIFTKCCYIKTSSHLLRRHLLVSSVGVGQERAGD